MTVSVQQVSKLVEATIVEEKQSTGCVLYGPLIEAQTRPDDELLIVYWLLATLTNIHQRSSHLIKLRDFLQSF
jgi:hypothetical protein